MDICIKLEKDEFINDEKIWKICQDGSKEIVMELKRVRDSGIPYTRLIID